MKAKVKRKGSAIENMGFYLIAIILAVVGIIFIIYLAGSKINYLINFFKSLIPIK